MDKYAELAELVFGGGADELVSKLSDEKADRRRRATTAGLSTIGAGAGALGLAVGAKSVGHEAKEAKKLHPGLTRVKALKAGWKATPKLTRALVPAEIAGLGGEVMATKILGNDIKRKKTPVVKMEPGSSDVHIPTAGSLKRVAAKKAYQKGKPLAQKAATVGVEASKAGTRKITVKAKEQLAKSDVTWEGEFSKVDTDKRQVFGWASIVEVNGEPFVDLQGDMIDHDELEKSAYEYVIKSRKGGDMHRRDGDVPFHASDMIESFIVTPEKKEKLGLPDSMPTGWWVGYQINDPEAWELVKSGKRTGFSIHGRGQRTPVEL